MSMQLRRSAAIGTLALLFTGPIVGAVLAGPVVPTAPEYAVSYSVWYPENDYTRVVIPPAFPNDTVVEDGGEGISTADSPNEYHALGTVAVAGSGWEHELSLDRITVPPGGQFRLVGSARAGLVVLESGWLELTDRQGPARVTHGPTVPLLAPRLAREPIALDAGDRLSFEPDATVVLVNRGEQPASLLFAAVATSNPG